MKYALIVLVALILQMDKTTIAFVVKYRNNVKIIKSNVENFKEDTLIKFRTCPAFPKQFIIQYENKLRNMMVDLDDPNELFDRKSKKINIISDESGDDGDRRATSNESESQISE